VLPLLAALGLAFAGDIAVPDLKPGHVIMVNGTAFEGTEARGLPGGAHNLHVVASDGRLVFRRRVLLRADERVELDLENGMSPELSRGPIPERVEEDRSMDPQQLVVGAVDWRALRLHLDGTPFALDPDTRTFRRRLEPGPHRLERFVAGRPKPPKILEVAGHPWQCAVARDGAMDCVELVSLPEAPVDAASVDQALGSMPVQDRMPYLLSLDARVGCHDLARWMDGMYGDEAMVTLALGMRAKVADPWNHVVLTRMLSFPESRRRVEALYGGQAPGTPQAPAGPTEAD